MRATAADVAELGCIIDEVIEEPTGGAHNDVKQTGEFVKVCLKKHLSELQQLSPEELVEQRYQKFRAMTVMQEEAVEA